MSENWVQELLNSSEFVIIIIFRFLKHFISTFKSHLETAKLMDVILPKVDVLDYYHSAGVMCWNIW